MGGFFEELQRRKVYRVAAAYIIAAGFIIQIASAAFPAWELPNWSLRLVISLLLIGFPVAVILAWAYDITPQGIRATPGTPGTHRRRNLISLILTAALASAAAGYFLIPRLTGHRIDKSVAVLPFQNLSSDSDNAYFTEGVQDEILARLARIADLKVISRTSTQRFKDSPNSLRQIAQQLGVANVLEGSVQKEADRVLVNVKLVDAAADAHLWGESFDRKLTDVFAVESEIATKVARALQATLTDPEQNALAARPTENDDAYELYLRGRFCWNKRTGDDLLKAIDYFEQAIRKDPKFAIAYAGLANAYVLLSGYAAASPKESLPKARAAAEKALLLNDNLGEAHAALTQVLIAYEFNFAEGEREFQRAIKLSPNYPTAHHWHAESSLVPHGRFDEAIAEIRRALELDPLSVIINADLGTILFSARRYDEAIEQLNRTLTMDPDFYYAHWALGESLQMKGRIDEAIAEYEKAIGLNDDPLSSALLANLYAGIGRKDEARKILARLHETSEHGYVTPYLFTLVHVGLGEKEQAIQFLEKAYEDRDGYNICYVKVEPFLDPLRGDPRFEAFVRKVFPSQ